MIRRHCANSYRSSPTTTSCNEDMGDDAMINIRLRMKLVDWSTKRYSLHIVKIYRRQQRRQDPASTLSFQFTQGSHVTPASYCMQLLRSSREIQ